MKYFKMVVVLMILLIFSCKQEKTTNASEEFNNLINSYQDHKGYDKITYPLGLFTKDYYKSEAEFAQMTLDELSKIDKNNLTDTERISADLIAFVLQDQIDYYNYEQYLNPLLSDAGFHNDLTYEVKPLSDYHQVKNYLNKLNAIPEFVNQYLINLSEGLAKGVSQPLIIFNGYESTYNDHIVDNFEDSFYYSPLKNLPSGLTQTQKDSVLSVAKIAIETKVTPQFKRIKTFFETEYLPKTRTTLGVSEIPNGKAFYQNRINYYTTSTEYSADDIHQIGLNEVARIKREMELIIKDLNFKGSFADFFKFLRTDKQFYAETPEQLLMIARDMAKRADAQLPRFFKTLPRKPYGVEPVPDAIAPKYTGGRYIGTSNESTDPGYYWVNTYDLPSRTLYTLPALTVHEAVPGHHLQGSLNNELGDSIPDFRKNLYLSAYGEGWGLYSEFLADEMGMYTTPYEQFGKLTYEMWRACRLVVDTGIHAKSWTREQVVAYMSSNTALSLHEINTETDRYISWPGQALSYKIGELKIRELRQKAEKELGSKFDIREFHEIILEQGTVTLAIMEALVNNYIQKKKMSKSTFVCIDAHTCGNPVRVITSGGPELIGKTMSEKRQHFLKDYDWIRKGLMFEPRGHDMMSGSILYPPHQPENDFAILFIETSGCLPMCGHGTIGTITIAIEEGLITPKIPGKIKMEAPAGLVNIDYQQTNGKVDWVKLTNVKSYLAAEGLTIDCPELGQLTFDVAYGGNYYAIIDPQTNFSGVQDFSASKIIQYSQVLRQRINEKHPNHFIHPENDTIKDVTHLLWTGTPIDPTSSGRNAVFYGDKAIDRSPCGTGTSARMAQLYTKGKLKKDEDFIHESYIGSKFIGRVEDVTTLDGKVAIVPSIKGWAKIYGHNTITIDSEDDPYAYGFQVI